MVNNEDIRHQSIGDEGTSVVEEQDSRGLVARKSATSIFKVA